MKYGLYLPNFGAFGDAQVLAQLAREAEDAGWDGFFLWDHVAGWDLPLVDPWVALSAIAMNTSRIKMGTTVTPIPRRRPVKLAREAVSLDRLSGGRLILGVGIGGGTAEYDDLGEETSMKARAAMLDEALTLITRLWRGETVNHEGQYYTAKNLRLLPTPAQSPRIPIWVGGFWPHKAPFRRAACWDGMFPLFEEPNLETFKAAVEYANSNRSAETPFDVVLLGSPIGATPENLSVYQAADATWWLEILAPYRYGQDLDGEWRMDDFCEIVLNGPPTV